MPRKVVLAYSGGLDTSIIIPWLKETYGCEVIAMIGDVGQQEDLQAAQRKALATGASSATIEDLREEFITDYIWPTLRAGAVYEHKYLLGTSMARPVLAKRQAEIALEGRRRCRWRTAAPARATTRCALSWPTRPSRRACKLSRPWREWKIQFARGCHRLRRSAQHSGRADQGQHLFSRDRNIWHLSHEGGVLEDPANAPDEAMWQWIALAGKGAE